MATRMRGTTASCSHTHTQTDRHGIQVKQLLLLWLVHPLAKFYLKEIPYKKKKKDEYVSEQMSASFRLFI